jgi:hypothetical protein
MKMPWKPTPLRTVLVVWIGLLVGVACLGPSGTNDAPSHGWWSERGPVVPHDSFPSDCKLCHKDGDWSSLHEDFTFDHELETGVPLDGAHARAECLRCHNDRGPVSQFAGLGCAGCHEDVHRGGLGRACADCHNESNWKPIQAIADHGRTRFPLAGAHAAVACSRCHSGSEIGLFTGVSVECLSCHSEMLAETVASLTTPDHLSQGWTSDCDQCHIPTTWQGGGFNHTGFNLTGAHKTAQCSACHAGEIYSGLPTDCYSCHMPEFTGANDHVLNSYPTDCSVCHSTQRWAGANFNHSAAGISSNCNMCHMDNFVATTSPNHVAENFSTTCEDCHSSTSTWLGAGFDHAGITTGCATCHITDYNATTSPNHMLSGFPTNCESCHTTSTWNGAVFNHSFPINSGDHKNLNCADCHTSPGNFAAFSCTDCHEHNKSDMDDKHEDEGGYVYSTMACYSCHPNGKD